MNAISHAGENNPISRQRYRWYYPAGAALSLAVAYIEFAPTQETS
ncbi:MAG: hypothetical protein ABIO49_05720 [Dokdonella sp.]